MSWLVRIAVVAFLAAVLPATSSLAQAPGYVRVKLLKAALMVGAGGGSGVLTYRGRHYPFRVSGLSLGVTAGASVSRLEGWASGIRQVSDFAGTYSAVGGGGAFLGGFGGVQLGNEKGVKIALQGAQDGNEVRHEPQWGQDFTEVNLLSRPQGVPPLFREGCLAVWLAYAGRSVTDKIVALLFPVSAFIAAGFEHCVANMYFLPLAWLMTRTGSVPADFDASLITMTGIIHNLVPITLGNIVGGAGLVGAMYWMIYRAVFGEGGKRT